MTSDVYAGPSRRPLKDRITVRMSPGEVCSLESAAATMGVSVSEYLRSLIPQDGGEASDAGIGRRALYASYIMRFGRYGRCLGEYVPGRDASDPFARTRDEMIQDDLDALSRNRYIEVEPGRADADRPNRRLFINPSYIEEAEYYDGRVVE